MSCSGCKETNLHALAMQLAVQSVYATMIPNEELVARAEAMRAFMAKGDASGQHAKKWSNLEYREKRLASDIAVSLYRLREPIVQKLYDHGLEKLITLVQWHHHQLREHAKLTPDEIDQVTNCLPEGLKLGMQGHDIHSWIKDGPDIAEPETKEAG